MSRFGQHAANLVAITIAVLLSLNIIVAAFFIGAYLVKARPKSDRVLCEERGGVYVSPRGDQPRCFAPEAFK
jgi:hypothetical protein